MNKGSQASNSCVVCKNKTKNKNKFCTNCMKNSYDVERGRTLLAEMHNLSAFKQSYSRQYAEIKNLNSQKFWDHKFSIDTSLLKQGPMTKDKVRTIVKFIPQNKKFLLDLGFGMGYLEEIISNDNVIISGIDISQDAVNRARKKFKGTFIRGNVSKIKKVYEASSFDIVIAMELIEHISPIEIFEFFEGIRTLLKKTGILIISTPLNEHLESKIDNPSRHVREYTIPIIKAELELSGFKIKKIKKFYAFRKFYFLKKFLVGIFPNHWEPNNVVVVVEKK